MSPLAPDSSEQLVADPEASVEGSTRRAWLLICATLLLIALAALMWWGANADRIPWGRA